MPEETPTEKPRVKTWKTIKKELDAANARVIALSVKLDDAKHEASEAKQAADTMAAAIAAELNGKPA